MRQDQYERLQKLGERVMDQFLDEADPDHWPGKGVPLAQMDAQTRGDLLWVRKNAIAAATLYGRIESMVTRLQMAGAGTTPPAPGDVPPEEDPPDDIETEMKQFERAAQKMIDDAKAGKKSPGARAHGKR